MVCPALGRSAAPKDRRLAAGGQEVNMKSEAIKRRISALSVRLAIRRTLFSNLSCDSISSLKLKIREIKRQEGLVLKINELQGRVGQERATKVIPVKNGSPKKGKELIKYGLNKDAMNVAAQKSAGRLKSFSKLMDTGYKEGVFRSR